MNHTLTIQRLGDSLGVTLPEAFIHRFQLQEGNALLIVERANGLLLTPITADDAEALEQFDEIRREYHDVFRNLARQ